MNTPAPNAQVIETALEQIAQYIRNESPNLEVAGFDVLNFSPTSGAQPSLDLHRAEAARVLSAANEAPRRILRDIQMLVAAGLAQVKANNEQRSIEMALFFASLWGHRDEPEYRAWALDQMVRMLTGANYQAFREQVGGTWEEGTKPPDAGAVPTA